MQHVEVHIFVSLLDLAFNSSMCIDASLRLGQESDELIKSVPSGASGRYPLDVQESGDSASSESAPLIQQQAKQASRFASQASEENASAAHALSRNPRASKDGHPL